MTPHLPGRTFRWLLATASILLGGTLATASANGQEQKPAPPPEEEELARVGNETTERVCSECHGIEVTQMRRTAREWDDVVTSMAVRGANATDDELTTIKRYLTRRYGIVRVNTASAGDLSAVLGLSARDATAIIDYRNANGKFADADSLAKVPGIDKTKIDTQRDALRFN